MTLFKSQTFCISAWILVGKATFKHVMIPTWYTEIHMHKVTNSMYIFTILTYIYIHVYTYRHSKLIMMKFVLYITVHCTIMYKVRSHHLLLLLYVCTPSLSHTCTSLTIKWELFFSWLIITIRKHVTTIETVNHFAFYKM